METNNITMSLEILLLNDLLQTGVIDDSIYDRVSYKIQKDMKEQNVNNIADHMLHGGSYDV
ncbi:hypothetical protein [Butyrivibrio sp. WCD3002]|uniref:hypothetical protein n=1 Tax=Butyrivibrio sp. WCD3002 TaxID=1280676 RepID=UPI00047B94FE|nr:hypothetical protein [Butyrivibrio sp. WCD3002]